MLALCPPRVRVAVWHRGERPIRSGSPPHALEPVIYWAATQLVGARRVDSIVCEAGPSIRCQAGDRAKPAGSVPVNLHSARRCPR